MNKRHAFAIALTTLLFSAITAHSAAVNTTSGANITEPLPFKEVGQGTMKWLWFDVYHATLSTPSGRYTPTQWPLSLELIYARNISRDDLIRRTEAEWRRQNIDYHPAWLQELKRLWPDIAKQDRLLLNVDENGHSHFYYNGHYLGSLNNQTFSDAFTAIWLSEKTLKPALRNQLTGLAP